MIDKVMLNGQEWQLYHIDSVTVGQSERLPLSRIPHTDYFYERETGYEYFKKLMLSTGHDPTKIDTAVPQDWWDQQLKKLGRPPWACWTYETNGAFGEPLYYSTLYGVLERALMIRIEEVE